MGVTGNERPAMTGLEHLSRAIGADVIAVVVQPPPPRKRGEPRKRASFGLLVNGDPRVRWVGSFPRITQRAVLTAALIHAGRPADAEPIGDRFARHILSALRDEGRPPKTEETAPCET